MTDVRDNMIEAMERLISGDMDAKTGQAIASLGKQLVDTAKVEVAFIKTTGIAGSTGFINIADPTEAEAQEKQKRLEQAKQSKFNVEGAKEIGHVK